MSEKLNNSLLGLRILLGAFFVGCLIYILALPIYSYFKYDTLFYKQETTYCGTILKRLNPVDDYTHKGNTRLTYEPTFVVKFEGYGTKEITPTTNDYYNHKEGDRVCYSFENERSTFQEIKLFFTLMAAFAWGILALILFVCIFCWVFGIKW